MAKPYSMDLRDWVVQRLAPLAGIANGIGQPALA